MGSDNTQFAALSVNNLDFLCAQCLNIIGDSNSRERIAAIYTFAALCDEQKRRTDTAV